LMATEIKCACGAIWERTEAQAVRDSDDFQCTCGRTLETWNRSVHPAIPPLESVGREGFTSVLSFVVVTATFKDRGLIPCLPPI
jgi:hypothetical protein